MKTTCRSIKNNFTNVTLDRGRHLFIYGAKKQLLEPREQAWTCPEKHLIRESN